MAKAKPIAVAHPGKLGDALYALPAIRYLCNQHKRHADFYTSSYCAPLITLLEQQSFIRKVIIPPNYVIENAFCGVQPWKMPVPEDDYEAVYQLGLQEAPGKVLPDFLAEKVGAPAGLPIHYEFEDSTKLNEPYIVIAPGRDPRFKETFTELVKRCPIKCVVIGAPGEYLGMGIDATQLDLLGTLPWIAHSEGFVGCMSSQLVLANAFPIIKVSIDDGGSWDMRHVMRGPLNFYPVMPTAEEILIQLGLITYSKTLHPNDYQWIGEAQLIPQMLQRVKGSPVRFEHEHRCWEYGLVLKALKDVGARKVLDVGGGGSVFAPSAAWLGMEVLQVDPCDCSGWVSEQAEKLRISLAYETRDFMQFHSGERFDAVTCLSVIEHVEADVEFFIKLLDYVVERGLLCLTTDFHPRADKRTEGHLRTYGSQQLLRLAHIAKLKGYEFFGPKPSYFWQGAQVNDYNFASLIMQRVNL